MPSWCHNNLTISHSNPVMIKRVPAAIENKSLCNSGLCPSSTTCRRHPDSGAIADAKYQLYYSFDLPEDADHCEDYWPIEEIKP